MQMHTGVSVNLAVTYLLPAPEGSELNVEARVLRTGKSLATIQARLKFLRLWLAWLFMITASWVSIHEGILPLMALTAERFRCAG